MAVDKAYATPLRVTLTTWRAADIERAYLAVGDSLARLSRWIDQDIPTVYR
ncbi:MAG: hypothetical protein ABI822_19390 [Bryobacteraceae bacterium]